ncbi:cell wall hydrolase [Thalassospira tepidiphila]|uniref:Hydrolase n=2 Tax=Thalassospira tepidiphila TaxID=393657 RepID=A0A853KY98_9PROT|nr:cell wall hydrolase [Thalassospira tepidiphila]NJB75841.1 spore germination cell wall hydrolase CwlJ-like protein [Thalassospira tepidiphila]OAZ08849.1 hydrolase [Thalassospira tepidiphila MCCC 1A03514]
MSEPQTLTRSAPESTSQPITDPYTLPEVEVLARTLYGEARGEELAGIEAVASVILNRVAFAKRRGRYWWGNDVKSVCLKPAQFSCWNEADPNRKKLLALSPRDPAYRLCKRIAKCAVVGELPDPTDGATHYHTHAVDPFWARGHVPVTEIGGHLFYKDIG